MCEELRGFIGVYKRRRFPKPIGYYTLLLTSKRIIVARTLPTWIEVSPLYAKGASYFIMRKFAEKHREKMEKLPFDEILKIDKENLEIPYADIREVRLYRRFFEYKLSIKLNKTEHIYNLVTKKVK